MKITYVTGNWAKILSARQILEPLGIEVDQVKMDTPEIHLLPIQERGVTRALSHTPYLPLSRRRGRRR